MTDKELIRKLLTRNHMLSARVTALAKRVEELEMTRPPADVLNEGMNCHHRMLEALRDAINLQGAAISTICASVELDADEVYEVAKQVNDEIKLEHAFDKPSAEREGESNDQE